MESVSCKWLLLSFLLINWEHSGWMKPSLFDGIGNRDMLDGAGVQLKSVSLNKYVSAKYGGGACVFVDQDEADTWETFKLWRVSELEYQFRSVKGKFLSCTGRGASVTATSKSPSSNETFTIERSSFGRVILKHSSGTYLQASSKNELKADFVGKPGFTDGNAAIFNMTFVGNYLQGEYQLSNAHGRKNATKVLTFLSQHGINTVRIPVGWWIAKDPNPPAPYVGEFGLKCIIDLHAAPGSQNGKDHSSSRDGSVGWPVSENIQQSLDTIEFLASKYRNDSALLGIDLLSEPHSPDVPFKTLQKYYNDGYNILRKHSATAYVIMCQLTSDNGANPDPAVLYNANTGKGKSNIVVDLHYYNLNPSIFNNMSLQENINYLYATRKTQIKSLNVANGPLVFIGEWVNEFGRGKWSQKDYQKYGSAQLDVYGSASFGWAYWSFKNDVANNWSFKWIIDNNYLQLTAEENRTLCAEKQSLMRENANSTQQYLAIRRTCTEKEESLRTLRNQYDRDMKKMSLENEKIVNISEKSNQLLVQKLRSDLAKARKSIRDIFSTHSASRDRAERSCDENTLLVEDHPREGEFGDNLPNASNFEATPFAKAQVIPHVEVLAMTYIPSTALDAEVDTEAVNSHDEIPQNDL
ncbi:hypothetical protein MKX03_018963 [Papaver bracteatum]|nr:hypothetical protein MKX03_018963 [Papaver bracteatum]